MASSSSSSPRSRRYDVFPSFSGEDVRKSFLSHLLKELDRRLINTFIDNGIERSRPIGPELFSAIRESRISIVVFSKNYASSTWCLNELVEIYKCYKELGQMVIPVFYDVDPSHVRKQTGDIGKVFEETCKGKTEDEKQWWIQALREVANIAGEDSRNWCDEANMIEKIADDVSNKLITPSDDFGDFVGIEAHLERLDSLLCLASGGVRMVGIVGPSGIGKSTIARALFSRLSSQFHHRAFGTYKRTNRDDYGMKLCWEEQFLGELLCQKDIRICHLGVVEQRLKHKKVLIVLDDVDDLELLKTLVGKTGWFGFGSRIIVITKDRQLLKSHKIDLIYEVEFPSEGLALKMFCRSAFGQNSPPHGFIELAVEVASLAGNLPLALNVLGSSLKGKDEEEWMEMLPRLRNGLDGKIEKTLRVSYDELDGKIQEVFLYIACLFNGEKVDNIKNFLGNSVNIDLRILADKSLISIIPSLKTVEMHGLLEKLGREIVRADSIYNPGKRRFLVDAEDIYDTLTDNTGTETVLGIYLNTLEISRPLFIDEKSFEGMRNLLFLKIYKNMMRKATGKGRVFLPRGLVYLPRKLRLLHWENYPSKSLPCNFRGEYLVELSMEDSELEKLWEGSQQLQSLKKMNLRGSKDLKEIPDLSNAINLEELHLQDTSLVTLPSSIRNLKKLRELWMGGCKKLEVLPTNVNLESLDYLDLRECSQLRSFPRMSTNISRLRLDGGTAIEEEVCFWIENLTGLTMLFWTYCPLRCMPPNFHPEYLVDLDMRDSKLEKLWEGVKSLGNLKEMNLSGCENLKEIPDLSTATNLRRLHLKDCKSLLMLTSSIQNLNQLYRLDMNGCTRLEVLPTNVNLISLKDFTLNGCSRLRNFPQISTSITGLYLDDTAIEEVPSWIENIFGLARFSMRRCKMLKNISPNIFKLKRLEEVDFSDCGKVTTFRDASVVTMVVPTNGDQLHVPEEASFPLTDLHGENCESLQDISHSSYNPRSLLKFYNCFNLEQDAQGLILPSHFYNAILPGGEVPMYFTHRSCGNSLSFPISQSSLSQRSLAFKACIVLEPLTDNKNCSSVIWVSWHFGGINGKEQVYVESCEVDHLVMLHFTISSYYFNDPQPEVDYSNIEFEFDTGTCSSIYGSRRYGYGPQAFRCSVQRIKGCGIRFLNASPSSDGIGRCFETEYNHQYGESDVESGRSSETQHNEQCVESGRSKKLIRVSLCRRRFRTKHF